ncbi:MAG: penicillin-binding protein [Nitrospirae bacterium]|nr:penicillin-binding protein [Nitrospirota bacterium]
MLVIVIGSVLWVYKLSREIPDDRVIINFSHDAATTVYDKDGRVLITLREDKDQIWVNLSEISSSVRDSLIATEDPYFMRHSGIDYKQTWESIKDNLRVWRLVRGGSTITQQVAKNVFLTNEKTFSRKIGEFFLARRLEKLLPKERIIEIYLNEVGWGYGIYGVELASRYYLDKHAADLNVAESAFMIAMLRNPATYNPYKNFEKVITRQQLVLKLMLRHKLIEEEKYNEALSYKIDLRRNKKNKRFSRIGLGETSDEEKVIPCHKRLIRDYLVKTLGHNLIFDAGVEIRSTLDEDIQDKLESIINKVEKQSFFDSKKRGSQQRKIVVLSSKNKIRAIGCTSMDREIFNYIKTLGAPVNNYEYRVIPEREVPWNDILLIVAGSENTL